MLKKLTNILIKDDVEKYNHDVFVEGIVIPSKMSNITRYSLINESTCNECNDIKGILEKVTFDDTESPKDRQVKLYNLCKNTNVSILNESADNKSIKRLSMSKDDYKIMHDALSTFKKTKDETVRNDCKKKFKSFVNTINKNIKKADDKSPVDAFINSLINSLYNELCEDKYKKTDKDVNNKDIIIAKLYLINKKL